jgi:hypothetical protein
MGDPSLSHGGRHACLGAINGVCEGQGRRPSDRAACCLRLWLLPPVVSWHPSHPLIVRVGKEAPRV